MSNYSEIIKNSKEKGIILDYCGSDERYYFNGVYTDLCGFGVQDYIDSTLLKCNNNTNDNSGEITPTKSKNIMTFTLDNDNNLIVFPQYAPIEDIKISCKCENNDIAFLLKSNSKESVNSNYKPSNNEIILSNVVIEPSEDEKYIYGEYKIIDVQKNEIINIYSLKNVINFKEINTLTSLSSDTLVENTLSDDDILTITYNRSADDTSNITDDEYDEWVSNNSYIPIIIVDKKQYDSGLITVYNVLQMPINNSLYEITTLSINGKTYSALTEYVENVTTEQTMIYNGVNILTNSGDSNINIIYNLKKTN